MFLKKLIIELNNGLEDYAFTAPYPVQKASIPKIKSGANCLVIAPEKVGKSTALVIAIIQQLKKALNDVPRAIIVVPDKESAITLKEIFDQIGKYTDLRTFTVTEGRDINSIKHEIYVGSDIIIGTVKRLNELYSASGLNLNDLQIFAIDDSIMVLRNDPLTQIDRWREILNRKIQYLIFSSEASEKLMRFIDKWDINLHTIKIS